METERLCTLGCAALLAAACGGSVAPSEAGSSSPSGAGASSGASGSGSGSGASGDTAPPCAAPTGVETLAVLADDGSVTTGRILVDEHAVYVDTNRGTYRLDKCGRTAPVAIAPNAPGQYQATGFVQDTTSIYLTATAPVTGGFVARIPKAGGPSERLVQSPDELFGLAATSVSASGAIERLAWIDKAASGGQLREIALTDRSTLTLGSLPVAYAYGPLVADGVALTTFAMIATNTGSFYRYAPGTGVEPIAQASAPLDVVVAGNVFFTVAHTMSNGIARLGDGDVSLAEEATEPYGIAARDGTLYYTDPGAGLVESCEVGPSGLGNFPRAIAQEERPRFVAVDDAAVYWGTATGAVRRAPR